MEQQKLPNSSTVLVLGILSLVGCMCYGILGLILGIVALVLAKKATEIHNQNPDEYVGINNVKTGKILAIISIVLSLVFIAIMIYGISVIGWDALQDPELMQERMRELQGQ